MAITQPLLQHAHRQRPEAVPRHPARVPHALERCENAEIAGRPAPVIPVWEQKFAAASERMQFAQQHPALARQVYMVIDLARIDLLLTHLHAMPLDDPDFVLEIDLRPRRLCQLTGAHEHHHHEPQHDPRLHEHGELVFVQRLQELG